MSQKYFGAIFVIYATLWTTKVKKKNEIHKVGTPDMAGLS